MQIREALPEDAPIIAQLMDQRLELINELQQKGIKHHSEQIVVIARHPQDFVVFLETGTPQAG
jgi:hypothetical protein